MFLVPIFENCTNWKKKCVDLQIVTLKWVANLKIKDDKFKRNILQKWDVPFLLLCIVEEMF